MRTNTILPSNPDRVSSFGRAPSCGAAACPCVAMNGFCRFFSPGRLGEVFEASVTACERRPLSGKVPLHRSVPVPPPALSELFEVIGLFGPEFGVQRTVVDPYKRRVQEGRIADGKELAVRAG